MFVAGFIIGFFTGIYVCHRLCHTETIPHMKIGNDPVLDAPTM